MDAATARANSERNKASIEHTHRRNATAKRREEAKREAEHKTWWAGEVRKDYEEGLAKAIKAGNRSFKVNITSSREISTVKEMMNQNGDAVLLRKIWRSLRARKFKVQVLVKSDWYSGHSMYEGIPDEDPYTSYTFTAKVSW